MHKLALAALAGAYVALWMAGACQKQLPKETGRYNRALSEAFEQGYSAGLASCNGHDTEDEKP